MQDHPFAAGLNVVVSRTADKGKDCDGKSILVAQKIRNIKLLNR